MKKNHINLLCKTGFRILIYAPFIMLLGLATVQRKQHDIHLMRETRSVLSQILKKIENYPRTYRYEKYGCNYCPDICIKI